MAEHEPDASQVFVVHGRNLAARDGLVSFLRAIGLKPIEFSRAVAGTGSAAPYIGQALEVAFAQAQAVVVLFTPDDIAYLRPDLAGDDDHDEETPQGQARPNVLFEAGLAFGSHPNRTVLVESGPTRPFSLNPPSHLERTRRSS